MARRNRQPFDKWWPIVIKLWRQGGNTAAVLESDLRTLYDAGHSPLKANDALLAAKNHYIHTGKRSSPA